MLFCLLGLLSSTLTPSETGTEHISSYEHSQNIAKTEGAWELAFFEAKNSVS
jgi:hypothetical protein